MFTIRLAALTALCSATLFSADAPKAADIYNRQLTSTEREVVSLVEAMPADKFGFAPPNGAFDGVRTFAQQAKHIAFVVDQVAAAMLGEANPMPGGADENGPANITGKEDVVKYVKDAFAYAHKAVGTLTNENLMGQTADPFNPKGMSPRAASAGILFWHTMDHYGQMVIYARMNGVIPPASQPQKK
jgi:hypothetical protein